jgi:cytochrome c-type biogenesis protein CcmH
MADWGFWAVAGMMALAVAVPLLTALRRGGDADPAASQDVRVYKDQLAEIDRDLTRGTIVADEAQRLRAEIGRRLIDADRAQARVDTDADEPSRPNKLAITVILLLAPATFLIYAGSASILRGIGMQDDRIADLRDKFAFEVRIRGANLPRMSFVFEGLGAPGYPDLPLQSRLAQADARMKSRPSQAQAVAAVPAPTPATDIAPDFLDLMAKLRTAVADRPTDLRGLELLSRNEAALGNFTAAEAAQRQLLAVKRDGAVAADRAALAEILIAAAGGYVSPEAEAELIAALKLDPDNPTARYFSGLMFSQAGRFDRSFALWQPLLDESPADAPWVAAIRAQIEDVAYRAGVNYTLPAEKGPDTAAVAAAGDMSDADRQAMIAGMVAQLSDRLAREGGTVEEWNQLIRALVVLDQRDQAQVIYDEAKLKFVGRNAELSFLKLAAVESGLAP